MANVEVAFNNVIKTERDCEIKVVIYVIKKMTMIL